MKAFVAAGCIALFVAARGAGAAGPGDVEGHRKVLKEQQSSLEREYAEATDALRAAYGRRLASEQDRAQAAGDLDAVLAIKEERQRLEAGEVAAQGAGDAAPAVLRTVRQLYRDAARKAERTHVERMLKRIDQYGAMLAARQKELVVANRLEEAVAFKNEAAQVEFERDVWLTRQRGLQDEPAAAGGGEPETKPADPPSAIPAGALLHYAFSRPELSQTTDASGRGNHGRLAGAKWVRTDRSQGALRLRGSGRVTAPDGVDVLGRAGDEATFSLWWQAEGWTTPPDAMALVCKRSSASPGLSFCVDKSAGGYYLHLYGRHWAKLGSGLGPGAWHQAVLTKSGTDWRVYHDGELQPVRSSLSWPPGDGGMAAPLLFGVDVLAKDYAFEGMLDEVRVWPRALTGQEVRDLYQAERATFAAAGGSGR